METLTACTHINTEIRYVTAADECRIMKMSERVTSCCVALLLVLTSVSAARKKLRSIRDLKKIDFGPSVPKHSLMLLHWFANEVDIDNNNIIQLTFDPNSDYGSHHYGNYEGLLDPLPQGYRYYTVGNLNQDSSMSMQPPDYVVHPRREYLGRNRDRIIIRVQEQRIDQVYITQHYDTSEHQGTPYDPVHTYQVTTYLLRQIREFSVRDNQQPLLYLRNRFGSNADDYYIRHTWGSLACLGLFLFIVIEEKHLLIQRNQRPEANNKPEANNRPEANSRLVNIDRQVIVNRWLNIDIPVNIDTPIEINILESSNRPESRNRCSHCGYCALGICCLLLFILALLIVFWALFWQ